MTAKVFALAAEVSLRRLEMNVGASHLLLGYMKFSPALLFHALTNAGSIAWVVALSMLVLTWWEIPAESVHGPVETNWHAVVATTWGWLWKVILVCYLPMLILLVWTERRDALEADRYPQDATDVEVPPSDFMAQPQVEQVLRCLEGRFEIPTLVRLRKGEQLLVHDIVWGDDPSLYYPHVTTNIDTSQEGLPLDFFYVNEVEEITDAASGGVLFQRSAGSRHG